MNKEVLHDRHVASEKTNTDNICLTYSKLGGPCRILMEAEHDDLQAVTAVSAFEETWLQQVRGHCGGHIDPPVCQTVTDKRNQITEFF